jgi:light-regulated signal transduction histidine kinase (bacteriophytochrome)
MSSIGGAGTAAAYPAMRELLRQGVAEAQAEVACVALLDVKEGGKCAAVVIPAVYPPAECSTQLISRWVRKGVRQAIEAGRTEVMVGRITGSGNPRRSPKMLVVAPMYTTNGSAWGGVAMVRSSPVVDWETINTVQQCSSAITSILTQQSDEPMSYPGLTVTWTPVTGSRVRSGPRNDFLLHELRVPLSAASYALEALAQRHLPYWERDDQHLLHTAQSGVGEAQRIIRSVSQWPALGIGATTPNLEAVAVDEMLSRAMTLLPSAGYKVVQKVDPGLPLVRGNDSWLTQVLVNLLENALKYSHGHTSIEVAAYQSDDDFVLISVRSWSKILPFHRDDRRREEHHSGSGLDATATSTGLGLNIARYFITSLGGELWIEGDGTGEVIVTLALPIVTGQCSTPASTSPWS